MGTYICNVKKQSCAAYSSCKRCDPAITGRFEVNYILGQKIIGGKSQTVVVDYRSQVEEDMLEYKELEYIQSTFNFD